MLLLFKYPPKMLIFSCQVQKRLRSGGGELRADLRNHCLGEPPRSLPNFTLKSLENGAEVAMTWTNHAHFLALQPNCRSMLSCLFTSMTLGPLFLVMTPSFSRWRPAPVPSFGSSGKSSRKYPMPCSKALGSKAGCELGETSCRSKIEGSMTSSISSFIFNSGLC